MDLASQLILLIIFGIIGFITEKLIGLNLYRIISDLGTAILVLALVFFVYPLSPDPNIIAKKLEIMITFFVESLPSFVIGDIAGTFVSVITGEK